MKKYGQADLMCFLVHVYLTENTSLTGILLGFAIGALGVAVQALRYEIRRLNKEIKNMD